MTLVDVEVGILNFGGRVIEVELNWLLQSSLLIGTGLFCGFILCRRSPAQKSAIYRTTLATVLLCPWATWGMIEAGFSGWSIKLPPMWSLEDGKGRVAESDGHLNEAGDLTEGRLTEVSPLGDTSESVASLPTANSTIASVDGHASFPSKNASHQPAENLPPITGGLDTPSDLVVHPLGLLVSICFVSQQLITAILLLRFFSSWRQISRIQKSAVEGTPEVVALCGEVARLLHVSPPQVKISDFLSSPCLAGWRQPVVLMPESSLGVPLRNVLIHELAHLRRGDGFWNLLRQLATSLFFFQPLMWKLSAQIEETAEEVCDDIVLELGGDRTAYARHLVEIAELSTAVIPLGGIGMVSRGTTIGGRVSRILDSSRPLSTRVARVVAVTVAFFGIVGTVGVGLLGAGPAAEVTTESAEAQKQSPAEQTDDAQTNTHSEPNVVARSLNIEKPVVLWKFAAPSRTGDGDHGEMIDLTDAVVGNGTVYVAARGAPGKIYALNAADGVQLWEYQDTTWGINSPPTIDQDQVYFGSKSGMTALRRTDGSLVWNHPMSRGAGESSPVVGGNVVYISSYNGHTYALDRNTGNVVWKHSFVEDASPDQPEVSGQRALLSEEDAARPSGAASDGTFFFQSLFDQSRVIALDCRTGALQWSFQAKGWISPAPTIDSGRVYVVSQDRNLYCLDRTSGQQLWKFTAPTWLASGITVHNGRVFLTCHEARLFELDAETGALLHKFETDDDSDMKSLVYSRPIVTDQCAYFVTGNGQLYSVDTTNSKLRWKIRPQEGSELFTDPVTDGQRIFVTSRQTIKKTGKCELIAIGPEELQANTSKVLSTTIAEKTPDAGSAPPAADQKAGKADGTVTGTVVLRSDGTPVANADVRLLNRGMHIGELKPNRVRSDAQGKFEFPNVHPGKYRLWAFHEDLASRGKMLQGMAIEVKADGTTPVSPRLELWPGNRLKVHVVSKVTQKPLEKARIRLPWTDTDHNHFTDVNGNVEILGLTPEPYQVEVMAEGHAKDMLRITLNAEQLLTEINVVLEAGGELSGRVVDASGQPLADVGISAFPAKDRGSQIEYVKTDDNGRYAFPYLPLSALEFSLSKDGYVPQKQPLLLTSTENKKALDVTLEGRPYGGGIHVTVRNEQGEPIPRATIHNHGPSSRDVRTGTTDTAGQCLLANMFKGFHGYEIVVRANGYAPQLVSCQPGPQDQPTETPVVLQRGHSLKGRVLLSDGSPASGQWVFFAHGESGIGGIGGRATTDKEGRFTFDSLPNPCTFTFHAPAGHTQISDLDLALDGENEVEIRLAAAAAIRGRVVDDGTGNPLPMFNVKLSFCRSPQPGDSKLKSMPGNLGVPGSDFAGPTGRFAVEGLVDHAPYQVTIEAPGYERMVMERMVATPPEGDIAEFKLSKIDPKNYRLVAGHLLSHDGQPVAGVVIKLLATKGWQKKWGYYPMNWTMIESGQIEDVPECIQFLSVTTDQSGAFHFPMVKQNVDLDLFYWGGKVAPGRSMDLAHTYENLSELQITTEPEAKLVISFDRKNFPDATRISMSSASLSSRDVSIGENETEFAVDGLGGATYRVTLQGKDVRRVGDSFTTTELASKIIELKPGDTQHVEFTANDRMKPK